MDKMRWAFHLGSRRLPQGRSHRAVALAATVVVAAMIASMGPATASGVRQAPAQNSGSLTFLSEALTWPTLDPASSKAQGTEQPIMSMIYGNLFTVKSADSFGPGLASGYHLSPNKLQFTIDLRPNLRFQDGTPLDGAAVANSLTRDLSAANGCFCRSFLSSISSVTAPSSTEAVINLKQPDGTLLSALATSGATYITSPSAVAKEGPGYANAPVGAGPFQVVSNTPSSSITLKRFPGYWDAKNVHLSTVHVISESSGSSAFDTVQSGGAQVLMIPTDPPVEKAALADHSLTVKSNLAGAEFLYMGFKHPPFNNILARQALQAATDQPVISKTLFDNYAPATQTLVGPGEEAYPGNTLPGYKGYDPTRAKQLVKKLGGLSFTIAPLTSGIYNVKEVEALQKEWTQVGIKATVSLGSEPTELASLESGSFQAVLAGYPVQEDAALSMGTVLKCPIFFDPGFCDTTMSNLLVRAQATASIPERAKLLRQAMTRAIVKDAAYVPLNDDPLVTIVSKKVHGFQFIAGQVYVGNVSLGG